MSALVDIGSFDAAAADAMEREVEAFLHGSESAGSDRGLLSDSHSSSSSPSSSVSDQQMFSIVSSLEDEPVNGGVESPCIHCNHLLTPRMGHRGHRRYDGVVCRVCAEAWHLLCLVSKGQLTSHACAVVAADSDDMEKKYVMLSCTNVLYI